MNKLFPIIVLCLVVQGCGAAKSSKARNDLTQIANSAHAYLTEYSTFPTLPESTFYSTLAGSNPRAINFLFIPPKQTDSAGRYVDPWGNYYRVSYPAPKSVTVSTPGPDGIDGNSDDIAITK